MSLFEAYRWMGFDKSIYPCVHHHNQDREHFCHARKFPVPLAVGPPPCRPPGTPDLLCVTRGAFALWSHPVCALCVWPPSAHRSWHSAMRLCISKRFLLITEWYFHTVYLFVYSVTCGWASGLLEFSFPVRRLWAFKYCVKYFRSFP